MKVNHLGRHQIDCGIEEDIKLVRIEYFHEIDYYADKLVACYKDVFSEAPYFENYDGKEREIVDAFKHFALDGVVVLLFAGDNVIGFGGCERASSSEVSDFLNENRDKLEVDLTKYVYMAELAIQSRYRRRGFGTLLVKHRLSALKADPDNGFTHVLMRTARVGSNSIGIYLRLGATVIDGLIQLKTEFDTKSNERVFLSAPIASLNL